jgi:hypothetical protein
MSSGSVGRGEPGALWEVFPKEMALGTLFKNWMMMEQEQGCTSVHWGIMMSIAV